MREPDGPGMFIQGIEACHQGNISSNLLTDYVYRIGKFDEHLYVFEADRLPELELLVHRMIDPKQAAESLRHHLAGREDGEEIESTFEH